MTDGEIVNHGRGVKRRESDQLSTGAQMKVKVGQLLPTTPNEQTSLKMRTNLFHRPAVRTVTTVSYTHLTTTGSKQRLSLSEQHTICLLEKN